MDNCIFCKIVRNEAPNYRIYEDDNFVAFLDINPVNPGHLDIVPKIHVGYIFDLPEDLYREIFKIAKKLAEPLQQAVQSKKVGMVVEGFGVDHVHVHLIPINQGNELDPHRARRTAPEELAEMEKKIKSKLIG